MNESIHAEKLREIGKAEPSRFNGIRRTAVTSRRVRAIKQIGLRKIIRTSRADITRFSRANPLATCACKDKDCWRGIYPETTRHYREHLYDPDPKIGAYEVRKKLYGYLKELYDEGIKKRYFKSTDAKIKLKYWVKCAVDPEARRTVCFPVFCQVMGVSKSTLSNIRAMVVRGIPLPLNAKKEKNAYNRTKSPQWLGIAAYIEALGHDLANDSPDTRVTELPMGTKQNYYELFLQEWASGVASGLYYRNRVNIAGDLKVPSRSLFYKVWSEEYGGLVVPRHQNRFSKCDTCLQYKSHLEDARKNRDHDGIQEWKTRLFAHYRWVTTQRRKYHWHRRKAADNPDM